MKIISTKALAVPEIKVIRFARFCDHRGFFSEQFRKSDLIDKTDFLKGISFVQANESFSHKGVVRGMHFQWNPYMGKLVRTLNGRMIDLVLDIRKGSSTFGKMIAYEMPASFSQDYTEWIWVPPGFAHGNFFLEESQIEYFCSGEYSQGCEAGISPLAADIDWSLCEPALKDLFTKVVSQDLLITDKDRNGFSLAAWSENPHSNNFIHGKL